MADYVGNIVDPLSIPRGVDTYAGSVINNASTITYAQRVWSTGTSVWCYYIGAINASPASTATTPNWVGSAIRHELLGPV
jgi:hypothetical protein